MSEPPMAPADRARAYYRALDEGDYDLLETLLAESFVHERPDRTFEGRARFVRFMREERPQTETTHRIETVFEADGGAQESGGSSPRPSDGAVAVRGRLLAAEGDPIVAFADVFEFTGERIARIETYTR